MGMNDTTQLQGSDFFWMRGKGKGSRSIAESKYFKERIEVIVTKC